MGLIRVLFLSDTHLGFDLPTHPRVDRRRRGPEFFAAFREVLRAATQFQVDCIVHGGDFFYRSQIPLWLVHKSTQPLYEVASGGTPILIVPGNHERSSLPCGLLWRYPNLHVFERPRTYRVPLAAGTLAISGFPFFPGNVRDSFPGLLRETEYVEEADVRLLCLHQAVEGAIVGPSGYVFRDGPEVIRGVDLPRGFAAILGGHIHRAQTMTRTLGGASLNSPVIFAGSTQPTSFAEKDETKGFMLLDFAADKSGGRLVSRRFIPLATRPMIELDLPRPAPQGVALRSWLCSSLRRLPADAIVKLRPSWPLPASDRQMLKVAELRLMAPPTMEITVGWARSERRLRHQASARSFRSLGKLQGAL